MKKYLKMTRNVVFFGGLYYIMTMICGMVYAIGYSISHKIKSSQNIQNAIMSNDYISTIIAVIIIQAII